MRGGGGRGSKRNRKFNGRLSLRFFEVAPFVNNTDSTKFQHSTRTSGPFTDSILSLLQYGGGTLRKAQKNFGDVARAQQQHHHHDRRGGRVRRARGFCRAGLAQLPGGGAAQEPPAHEAPA